MWMVDEKVSSMVALTAMMLAVWLVVGSGERLAVW